MKLSYPQFDEPLEFVEGIPNILVLEDKRLRVQFIEDLKNQIETGEGSFVLSNQDEVLKIEKLSEFLMNPFTLDINQKKILTKIQATLKELANNESNYAESMRIIGEVNTYFQNLGAQVQYPIVFNDNIELQDLIKISGARIETESTSFFESVLNYMCLLNDVLGISLFVTLNIQLYIQEKELLELYKIAHYKKISLLLVESFDMNRHNLLERVTIIDKDLCVIKNF